MTSPLLRIATIAFALNLFAAPAQANDVNTMCPVLGDQKADPAIVTTYKGKPVHFCCNECKQEFEANPEVYVDQLPQLQELTARDEVASMLEGNTRWIIAGGLLVLLIGLMLYRRLRKRGGAEPTESGRFAILSKRIPVAWPLAAVIAVLGYEVYTLRAAKHETYLEDNIHFATFYDFGYPPVPKRPPVPRRLRGTYYRGNDERSPKLFNNGNYRTATFHLSLCDAEGKPLDYGADIDGQELFVKLEIDRPPFTPDFLYSEKLMGRMYLTQECDKFLGHDSDIPDRVNLTCTEKMQRWEARFPIGMVECCNRKRGIIYVCEEYHNKPRPWSFGEEWIASRFHYGIVYELQAKDGKLTTASDLFMGSLYRTRKFPAWKVPLTEWFSHEPIPVLPSKNIDDPELLGTSEHEKKLGE